MHESNTFLTIVVPYINFAVFAALLFFFARKKIPALFQARREKFENQALTARERYDHAKAEHERVLAQFQGLQTHLQGVLKSNKDLAEAEKQTIRQETERVAQALRHDVERMIQSEMSEVREELAERVLTELKSEVKTRSQKEISEAEHLRWIEKQSLRA